ncbi:monovalent cation/H(+) antiporter subunit G [Leucobacter soli]|uniref:Na(+)/H(+) antiporter subunit G n=1 Tax=Leucobacter soli TaxID=2812850 RepID=A0A916JRV3_9MICO|nr:monovalent cation/H(+) antiporter subunit G [Leucobacter soli]CAG7597168.1 Na(+)/H(+) antiporter subunit G [Leucobacter soli]
MSEWMETAFDIASLTCVLVATGFTVAAGVGLLRFPDALSRLHAATKPQVFGLLLVIAAIAFESRSLATLAALIPVFIFQSLTAPIAAHMVGRAAYRNGQIDPESLTVDELGPAIARAESTE